MTDTITLPRSVVEQALDALKIGHESARDCAETFHIEMAGYKQQRHEALDAEVKQISDAIGVLRAALEQPQDNSPEIQEGWRLVPVEPADSQIRAAQDTWWYACNCETYWDQIYAAMIAAAPQPPTTEQSSAVQPPVEQEPFAWTSPRELEWGTRQSEKIVKLTRKAQPEYDFTKPLYTRPQPRQPLTDAQINDHRLALPYDGEDLPDPWDFKQGVRAAERAHKIGGEA